VIRAAFTTHERRFASRRNANSRGVSTICEKDLSRVQHRETERRGRVIARREAGAPPGREMQGEILFLGRYLWCLVMKVLLNRLRLIA
jgi:hypothetical protein